MRYGILSDVHGNLHALRAVLRALRREGVVRLVCAGDLVGYGPFPNECVELLADAAVTCVAGNHDLMAIGRLSTDGVPPNVRRTQAWTRSVLTDASRAAISALPTLAVEGPLVVTHGSLDSPTEYVRTRNHARAQLELLRRRWPKAEALVLGHTHFQRVVAADGEAMLVNPGSVGQSRQWELVPRARFAVLDTERRRVELHATDYDRRAARAALRERGLPPSELHAPRSVRRAIGRRARSAWRRIVASKA